LLILKNEEMILGYCRNLLKNAKKRVVISMWDSMYELLREDIEHAAQNVQVQGMTLHVENPLSTLDQHRPTHFTENKNSTRWFILSADGEEMVYGAALDTEPAAFYTDDAAHIYLLEDYIWHDILVNRLVQRNNDNLEDWITAERAKFFG
jgi:HTH-type transcriptional regulator, sugar sensing transcriptional regulator